MMSCYGEQSQEKYPNKKAVTVTLMGLAVVLALALLLAGCSRGGTDGDKGANEGNEANQINETNEGNAANEGREEDGDRDADGDKGPEEIVFSDGSQAVQAEALSLTGEPMWSGPVRGSWLVEQESQGLTLAKEGAVAEIVVSKNEHSAVRQAAKFLSEDIFRISGHRPNIVSEPTGGKPAIRFATIGVTPVPDFIDTQHLEGQWEAFQIVTSTNNELWLVGSNFRGTAYAGYTLSERIGIDPLYHWTGYKPEHRDPLVIRHVNYISDPPTFKYRGAFHDDEDILPRPFDIRGYPHSNGKVPLEWYRKYFETALRLKLNIVAPYTRTERRYSVQHTASEWGLMYTSHHYDILLSNPYGMFRFNLFEERGLEGDWDWFNNRENMLKYWRAGVEENKRLNTIWPVGLRGTEDLPYPFPSDMSPEEQGKVYSEVIREQVKMVKEIVDNEENHVFHFTIYGEMLEKYQQGNIEVPEDVIVVWPDNSLGKMLALPDENTAHKKHGVYYHLAFAPTTLQVTHLIPAARVASEFRKIVNAGATEFVLVNVSELREYVKEFRLLADIAWDANAAFAGADPEERADRFLSWFGEEYFGREAAPQVKQAFDIYDAMFENHNMLRHASDLIHNELLDMLRKKVKGEEYGELNPHRKADLISRNNRYREAETAMNEAAAKMSRRQQRFFHVQMIGLTIEYRHNQAALKLIEAIEAPTIAETWQRIEEAMAPLEQLEIEILRAEYPPFENWYAESWLRQKTTPFNVHRPYEELRLFITTDGEGVLQEIPREGDSYYL